jgi:hypothetical protein
VLGAWGRRSAAQDLVTATGRIGDAGGSGEAPSDRGAARGALERTIAADDDAMAVAEAYFRLGVLEEEDGAFARAVSDQEACRAKAPASNWARSARLRIGWMVARSEGNYAPLARLQRVRHDPAAASNPAAVESLARDAESFPPGRVRAEARMFVGETWLVAMNRRRDAISELRKVEDDPSSDATDATLAHGRLVDAFLAEGWLDDAAREVERRPTDATLADKVRRLVFHRTLWRAAVGAFVAFAAFVAAMVMRAAYWRRHARR